MLAQLIQETRMTRVAVLALALATMFGCGNSGPTCGTGTVLSGTACVPTGTPPDCGPGTVLVGMSCVVDTDGSAGDVGPADTADAANDVAQPDTADGSDDVAGSDAAADTATDTDVATDADVAPDADGVDADTADLPEAPTSCLVACPDGYACSSIGTCELVDVVTKWTCAPNTKGDGTACDCACGEPDPDCANAALPVIGCTSGVCKADGTCGVCQPNCTGKVCGDDGCGGICGVCQDPSKPWCASGQCSAQCVPACAGKTCGPDGCGGTCGDCQDGESCFDGNCGTLNPAFSCAASCGYFAPGGCSCQENCAATGDCCADVGTVCACFPNCTGLQCGDDGCGGSCGDCSNGDQCVSGLCVADLCNPDPCSTHGSCDSTSGACSCTSSYAGDACDTCAAGLVDYPNCTPDLCAGKPDPCNGHGACVPVDGSCACSLGFGGTACDTCVLGSDTFPNCTDPCIGVNCDDGNACTNDICDATGTCQNVANTATCDDGYACTTDDVCNAGSCSGTQVCTIAVNSSDDVDDGTCDTTHCSLREALTLADSNLDASVIGFAIDANVTLTSALSSIDAITTIDGLGHAVTIDGDSQFGVFAATNSLTLRNLTIQNGSSSKGGAVALSGGMLKAEGVQFKDNAAVNKGGAIWAGGSLVLHKCGFAGNSVTASASGTVGGAVAIEGSAEVKDCHFDNNQSADLGGAIDCAVSGSLVIATSSFTGNSAENGGALSSYGTLTMTNSTLASNSASISGGAISGAGTMELRQCSLSGNSAPTASGVGTTTTVSLLNTLIVLGAGGGLSCVANDAATVTGAWIDDGSCGAAFTGPLPGLALQTISNGTQVLALGAGSSAIDAGDAAVCADASVGGVDQREMSRPQGNACDIGAFEFAP